MIKPKVEADIIASDTNNVKIYIIISVKDKIVIHITDDNCLENSIISQDFITNYICITESQHVRSGRQAIMG